MKDIEEVTHHVQELVPDATVVYAHGQMPEHKLEQILLDFVNGDIDVLVSTTIIETGLDIPNANTMIIQDADRMGLSQLYQLRGRVGRSNRTSYAFLMYKRDKLLKEEAEKRLAGHPGVHGAGFRCQDCHAGSGDPWRGQCSGRGAARPYGGGRAMICTASCSIRRCRPFRAAGTRRKISRPRWSAMWMRTFRFPILKVSIRSWMYKRISGIENEEEYLDMQDELMDRFGDIPKAVANLLQVAF